MYDVFISHSSQDKDNFIRNLVSLLEKEKLKVWYDENCIFYGDDVLETIKKGLEQSICGIVFLSTSFFESNWTLLETGYLLSKETERPLIPIIHDITIDDVVKKLPFLGNIKYISTEEGLNVVIDKIVSSVNHTKNMLKTKVSPVSLIDIRKKLSSIDIPIANTLCISIQKYSEISRIDSTSAIICASSIVNQILLDINQYLSGSSNSQLYGIDLLHEVSKKTGLINQNIYEHFRMIYAYASDVAGIYVVPREYPIHLVELSLTAILDWFIGIRFPKKETSHEELEVVHPGEFDYNDFEEMYEVDKMVLRSDLIAKPDITYKWYSYNNYTHIGVKSKKTKKVIGYFTVIPITDELYDDILSGEFKDNELPIDKIRQYDFPDFYKLYIACVCVHPEYQNVTNAFTILYNALIEMMLHLAKEREIYITDLITEASTMQGEKLCKIVGMKKLIDTNLETEIYGATLLPPALRLRSIFGHELIKFYERKYNEFKEFF